MTRFRMTRVETPAWAARPDARLYAMRLSEYHAVQLQRERMLAVVHEEVESYLNTPGLYSDGKDEFPDRSIMTGEYYLGDESYEMHVGPVWIQIGVMCHCLAKQFLPRDDVHNYLGLEVWLRCDPRDWSFTIFRNTDSSAN